MKRYWISWDQPTDDYRPLTSPPNQSILGWWCSGHSSLGATICAVVEANNDAEAQVLVCRDWPEAIDWRFCEEMSLTFTPGDRFPLSDWMVDRFNPHTT